VHSGQSISCGGFMARPKATSVPSLSWPKLERFAGSRLSGGKQICNGK